MSLVSRLDEVQHGLDALARQHGVPGASLGLLLGEEYLEFVTGVASRDTGASVTPDTMFQIGSNTKVYTATLLMQLVDEGLVDLDSPVRKYLPGFALADADAADSITVRHLLTHTSGIEGDHYQDSGWGNDSLERYVDSLAKISQIHGVGNLFSYCNSGFCVAGRVIESVTGRWFHEVIRDRLFAPLGLRRTTLQVEEMVGRAYAVGHVPGADGAPSVVPTVLMTRSLAAAGSLTSSTARDVIAFARMHLDGGRAADGAQVLSEQGVDQMQQPQHPLPRALYPATDVGLSWMLSNWGGVRVLRHGGGTIGQLSFLFVIPDRRFAFCLLTNSVTGGNLFGDLGRWVFDEIAGVPMPQLPAVPDPAPSLDLARYEGTYQRLSQTTVVTADDRELVAEITPSGPLVDEGAAKPQTLRLRPIEEGLFRGRAQVEMLAEFIGPEAGGRPRYFHLGGRASRRND